MQILPCQGFLSENYIEKRTLPLVLIIWKENRKEPQYVGGGIDLPKLASTCQTLYRPVSPKNCMNALHLIAF